MLMNDAIINQPDECPFNLSEASLILTFKDMYLLNIMPKILFFFFDRVGS